MSETYPFEPGPVLVDNAWYVAAWSSDVSRTPIQRSILGQQVVLYRTDDGKPVALADRCPHRGFRLSMSRVVGDQIECGYHGFTFDSAGQCVRIPSQAHIPAGFRTRCYPTIERWKWVWIWAGSAEDADPSLIPDHEEAGLMGGNWLAEVGCDFSVRARYQLFNENLLDLTHLTSLHSGTIGTPGIATAKVTTEVEGRVVRVKRDTLDEAATPFYAARLGISVGKIDRRHVTTFIAPSFHVIHVTTTEAASAADGHAPAVYGEHKIVHAITPETETTMRDFWAFTRTYNQSAEMSQYLRKNLSEVIRQDIEALEAVESLIGDGERRFEFSCAADEASLKGRQVVQTLLREQCIAKESQSSAARSKSRGSKAENRYL